MVYKVCKGGVRSGNTLRGLQTLRSKRYSRHGCFIGRSSLPTKDVSRLLQSCTDDVKINKALLSTNVVLSLNKRQRWLLPATVNHMVRSGQFNNSKAMVSVLERHKLKRRANCISFVCNKGRLRSLAPGQKRYFSFNLDNIDEDVSNRELRRLRTEKIKKEQLEMRKQYKKDTRSDMKSVDVFTQSGRAPKDSEGVLISKKPEYRLEVFYPCPSTCSLTFNPKYTDVVMEKNDDGEMEVRANKKQGKKAQSHNRRRFHLIDINKFCFQDNEEDVQKMWEEEFQEEEQENFETVEASTTTDYGSEGHSGYSVNVITALISHAEKAKALFQGEKRRKRRRSGKQQNQEAFQTENKSHVRYAEVSDSYKASVAKVNYHHAEASVTKKEYPTLQAAKVIMAAEDVSPNVLKQKFGSFYAEAESEPRRFIINVTDDVTSLLTNSRAIEQSPMYTSFIVFIEDSWYDEGLVTYKIIFNSNVCWSNEKITSLIPFVQTNVEDVMNYVVGGLLDMKEEQTLNLPSDLQGSRRIPGNNILTDFLKISVDTFYTSDEISRVANSAFLQEREDFGLSLMKLSNDEDLDLFCEICYDSIKPSLLYASPGTRIAKCGHMFCDSCWKSHLRTKAMDGALQMKCPGYDCNSIVGPVTLLSLLHVSEVSILLQRVKEDEVETSVNAKWCPNPTCGRVIRLNFDKINSTSSDRQLCYDVTCACGETVCFACLSSPHWPAMCDQAEEYMQKMSDIKAFEDTLDDSKKVTPPKPLPKEQKKLPAYEVEGRMCPVCRRFIEKNGGCPHMVCKCGMQFCWSCMKPYQSHGPAGCKPDLNHLKGLMHRVKVYHIDYHQLALERDQQKKKEDNLAKTPKQRATMYQRALQQRNEVHNPKSAQKSLQDLAMKITCAAHKDVAFKKQVLVRCGLTEDQIPDTTEELVLMPVKQHILRYLDSCRNLKRELHHVSEFTFVFLQDIPQGVERRRVLCLANDTSAYCSFLKSVLESGDRQDPVTALRRLSDIWTWAKKVLDTLLITVNRLKPSA